jgi:hypothetical protein
MIVRRIMGQALAITVLQFGMNVSIRDFFGISAFHYRRTAQGRSDWNKVLASRDS